MSTCYILIRHTCAIGNQYSDLMVQIDNWLPREIVLTFNITTGIKIFIAYNKLYCHSSETSGTDLPKYFKTEVGCQVLFYSV